MFGKRIKELRIARGVNQVEFGKALSVTKQSVSNWENGNILPSIDMLIKIAESFSVSTDYLLGLSDKRYLDVSGLTEKQISNIQNLVDDIRSTSENR
ncbi:MAG: helix-turn-helix transcriptional regulator [Ruminococcaceae bacterium]|nr:helix-turn-helix transcriptional regulator [Oscillospiraceae bacterium]